MKKIALTLRKKEDQMTFFMNNTYYEWLSPYFDIELIVPRVNHQYHDIVERNDALLICGGNDICPSLYNQEKHPSTLKEDHLIETMDFDLLKQFNNKQKPIIGICRGIQVINVFLKGNLYQDIPSQYPTIINHNKDTHLITPIQDTFFYQYFKDEIKVNSFHHQNIKDLSPLLKINAISEDGLIEGVENKNILAVQWHPERLLESHQKKFIEMMIEFIEHLNYST